MASSWYFKMIQRVPFFKGSERDVVQNNNSISNKKPLNAFNKTVEGRQENWMEKLIEKGAFWNRETCPNDLLIKAVETGSVEEVREWIKKGVHLNHQDSEGRTALSVALKKVQWR